MRPMRLDIDGRAVTLTILDQSGTYDYEWSEFAVMRGDDGALYVGATGGCSCNDFEENLAAEDVIRVPSWQDAARRAQLWAQGDDYTEAGADVWRSTPYNEDEKRGAMDLIERLSTTRPAAFEASAVVLQADS